MQSAAKAHGISMLICECMIVSFPFPGFIHIASVDNETEAAMQRSLRTICVDRTTLVIAHRLSTVRNAASINVLDEGRVVERGNHEELLALDGIYAQLWRVQTGEAVTGGSVAD